MRNEGEDREAVFANYATAYAVVRYTLDLPFAGVSIMAVTQGLGGLSRVRRVEKRRETVTRLAADITGSRFALSRSTLLGDMETAARAELRQRLRRRRRVAVHRRERRKPIGPNQVWSLDFVADQLADGRRFRALTVVDVFTRESLAIEVGQSLKGEDVAKALNRVKAQHRVPKMLSCDNGSEFSSQAMDLWAYQNGVRIDFSRPGKLTDNAHVESFNGTFRQECLNAHWFTTLREAQEIIEAWRREHNESRPHRALGERTPNEFAFQVAASRDLKGPEGAENSL